MYKVLIIDTSPMTYDGIYSSMMNYIEHMDRSDIQLDVVAMNKPVEQIISKLKKDDIPLHILPGRKTNPLLYMSKLLRLIRSNNYNLVHVHGSSCLMVIEMLTARLACVCCCPHSHNTSCENIRLHRLAKPLFHFLYKNGFACSEAAGRWVYDNRDFFVIKNGIDCRKYRYNQNKSSKIRQTLSIPATAIVLVSVANFVEVKNHRFMITLMRNLITINTDYYLICVGVGLLMDMAIRLVIENGLENNVRFLGMRNDVSDILSAGDIFIMPSLYEGFPYALVEAQASGLDCIVSSNVTHDCCFSNRTFFLPLDIGIWVARIMKFQNNRDRIQNSEQNIRNIQAAGYEIEKLSETLKVMYKKYGNQSNE